MLAVAVNADSAVWAVWAVLQCDKVLALFGGVRKGSFFEF